MKNTTARSRFVISAFSLDHKFLLGLVRGRVIQQLVGSIDFTRHSEREIRKLCNVSDSCSRFPRRD